MEGKPVGKVTHYYDKIGVAIIELSDSLKQGERVKFVGKEGEFTQEVTSMQYEHQPLETANKGQSVGMKVDQKVRENDAVYTV